MIVSSDVPRAASVSFPSDGHRLPMGPNRLSIRPRLNFSRSPSCRAAIDAIGKTRISPRFCNLPDFVSILQIPYSEIRLRPDRTNLTYQCGPRQESFRRGPQSPATCEARMLINSRRRFRSPAAWALVVVFGAPALVEAQQSGLFPNAPINRERVPCPHEDPVYRLYRHQYFGYHPTCWRRFPEGWGCPSPEAPNVAQAFRDQPRDAPPVLPPDDEGDLPGDLPGDEAGGPRADARDAPPPAGRHPQPLRPGRAGARAATGDRTRCFPSPRPFVFPIPAAPGSDAPTAPGDTTAPAGVPPPILDRAYRNYPRPRPPMPRSHPRPGSRTGGPDGLDAADRALARPVRPDRIE